MLAVNAYLQHNMASGVESKAVFFARALAIGLEREVVDSFVAYGLATMAQLAFGCAFQPGQQDETPLTAIITAALDRAPTVQELANIRRLWYESHAAVIQDMRCRTERTDSDGPKKLAPAERAARLVSQQARLAGIVIAGDLEPSFSLLDKVCQQFDLDQLSYIGPEECSCRSQEIVGIKRDHSLKLERDQQGNLKAKEDLWEAQSDVASDYKLRQAFTRRSLAYDQANLILFSVSESWIAHLFVLLHKEVPAGYSKVSLAQLLNADRELYILMADRTRASIVPRLANVRPLDAAMIALMHSPEVAYLTLPLPLSSGRKGKGKEAQTNDSPYKSKGKGKEKGKSKGKDKGKSSGKNGPPSGCVPRLPDGRNVCFGYNSARGCSAHNVEPGGRCRFGFHICGRAGCHANHSMMVCGPAAVAGA